MAGNGNRRGRTPALDEAKQREICEIIAMGGSRLTAAGKVGCAVATIRRTAARNPEFAKRLSRAESDLEVTHLENIKTASQKCWRASAWALERLHPERYSKRGAATVTPEQVSHLLGQFAEILVTEIPSAAVRRKIIAKIDALGESLLANEE